MAQHGTTPTDPAEAILAAIGRLGQATPRDIAAEAGVAYSTTTRNLRELAAAGRADKLTDDGGRTLWRLPQSDTGTVTLDPPDNAPSDTDSRLHADADLVPPAVPDHEPGEDPNEDPGEQPGEDSGEDRDVETTAPDPDAESSDMAHPAPPVPAAEPIIGVDDVEKADPADQADRADRTDRTDPVDDVDRMASSAAGDPERASGPGQPVEQAPSHPAQDADAAAPEPPQQPAGSGKPRRASGTLDGAVLDILEAHPEQTFKVSQLCKLIDAANEGSDTAKASAGAVVLACQRLVGKGRAVLAVEKPATFQLATAASGR